MRVSVIAPTDDGPRWVDLPARTSADGKVIQALRGTAVLRTFPDQSSRPEMDVRKRPPRLLVGLPSTQKYWGGCVNPDDQKALDDIENYGCHVIHVFEEDDLPRFSYSIGIQKTTDQPELIVTGLKSELAHWIINEYNRRVRAGERFEADRFYDGFLEGFEVTFKPVERTHYREYFGWARWLYRGDNFNALQLIYPSTSGLWPWDASASPDFKWAIPPLYAN